MSYKHVTTTGIYQYRKTHNQCVACTVQLTKKNNPNGNVVCKSCKDNRREYCKQRRKARVQAGLCRCGKKLTGHYNCTKCHEKVKAQNQRRSAARNNKVQ